MEQPGQRLNILIAAQCRKTKTSFTSLAEHMGLPELLEQWAKDDASVDRVAAEALAALRQVEVREFRGIACISAIQLLNERRLALGDKDTQERQCRDLNRLIQDGAPDKAFEQWVKSWHG